MLRCKKHDRWQKKRQKLLHEDQKLLREPLQ